MATVHDVAAFILREAGPLTVMKLQKLAYYSQAWHMVWDEEPLFDADFQAWANGPVCRELYDVHRGQFLIEGWPKGDADGLTDDETASVRSVLAFYNKMSAHELSELTHRERPWRSARKGLSAGARSEAPITKASMAEYYDGLTSASS
jgi:uncharacterized phage-associated protein